MPLSVFMNFSSLLCYSTRPRRLKAEQFSVTNQEHLKILKELGISMVNEANGKVQLVHQAALVCKVFFYFVSGDITLLRLWEVKRAVLKILYFI